MSDSDSATIVRTRMHLRPRVCRRSCIRSTANVCCATPAASATTSSRCQREPHPVNRIKLDLDRTLGAIDRNVFGGFVEHLGRCVYGGIYDPGSPLADAGRAALGRPRRRSTGCAWPTSAIPAATSCPAIAGAMASAPSRTARAAPSSAWDVRRAEHLRDQRVHRLLPDARRGALPRRELRRRRPARGARLGRVLQRHHRHGARPAARQRTAIPSRTASATGASATRSTAPGRSAAKTAGRVRPDLPRVRQGHALDGPEHQAHRVGHLRLGRRHRRARPGSWSRRRADLIDYVSIHWYVGDKDGDSAAYLATSELIEDRLAAYRGPDRAP